MKRLPHTTAKSSHYNQQAQHYDVYNEKNSEVINTTIEKILKQHNVQTILDLTCGTGSQVFWLTKRGYCVVGSDISSAMLKMAKAKAQQEKLAVQFLKGDMRTMQVGMFDAVITIFNAIGHLTKFDFEQAMRNIHTNLKPGGLYIFDINNLSYLSKGDQITSLTIDWQKISGNTKIREIQYSTIDTDGVLASYTINHEQEESGAVTIVKSKQTLQVYTAKQLQSMLKNNGFEVLGQYGIDGSQFVEHETPCILIVAQKVIPS